MNSTIVIERDKEITSEQIGELRTLIGWEPLIERFDDGLKRSYTHFSIIEENKLIGFARVISDGSLYAFIVDVMIHPEYQKRGLGKQLINHLIQELQKDDIRLIQLVFSAELESFYEGCGFSILKAGSIKNS